jgi:hypothetical protein
VKKEPSYEEVLQTEFGGNLAGEPIVERALRENSLQMLQDNIGAMLGHLTNFVPKDRISCAQLVSVKFVKDFIKTQQTHKGVLASKGRTPSLARKDGKDLEQIAGFVSYMAEDQSFAEKLTAIPGFLTARQASGMRMHWKKFALQAAKEIRALGRREVNHSVVMVDYAAPIKHLLRSPRPMSVIYDMVKALIRRVDEATGTRRDKCLRDLFVVGVLLCQDVFRPSTCIRLRYTDDETSNVVREVDAQGGEKLRVVADKEPFKNWDQDILKDGFSREIIDLFGRLYPLVNEYLEVGRQRMLGRTTMILAVNTPKNPKFSTDTFTEYMRRLTERLLLVDLGRKYGDVTSLNCTQIRKLVATAMWRAHPEDKELEAVCRALMNQIPWVYTHIAAAEKSKEMEALLRMDC